MLIFCVWKNRPLLLAKGVYVYELDVTRRVACLSKPDGHQFYPCAFMWINASLSHKLKTHMFVLSTVVIDDLVLKHQTISTHSTDQICIVYDHFYKKYYIFMLGNWKNTHLFNVLYSNTKLRNNWNSILIAIDKNSQSMVSTPTIKKTLYMVNYWQNTHFKKKV